MKPMLSATLTDPSKLGFPVMCSPKLDGIRCLIIGGEPVTRNFKKVPNAAIREALTAMNLPPFDGELIVGDPAHPDCYRATNSGVMSRDGEPKWFYHIFDMVSDDIFTKRLKMAQATIKHVGDRRLKLVPHRTLHDLEDLEAYEAEMLAMGYEGIMGRDPAGDYKFGRSTMREGGLWKLKRFEDGEAEIIGFQERMHNANEAKRDALGRTERSSHKANMVPMGTLGALHVRDVKTGVTFDIGTGFCDEERADFWEKKNLYVGATVKYKSQPTGVKDKPRFPVYLGLRSDL